MKSPEQARHEPYDVAIEQALLGSMLVSKSSIDAAAADLVAEQFFDPLHARIFETVVYLSTEGDVSPLLVNAIMKSDPGLVECGGIAYLAGLMQAAPSMPNVRDFARVITEMAQRRQLIAVGEELIDRAYDVTRDGATARTLADIAGESLTRIGAAGRAAMLSPYETGLASANEIERIWRGEQQSGITTGLKKLDDETGGFQPGDFVTIAGKPGMGKSALMGSISVRAAMAGVPTYVFSLEMSRKQWVDRLVCDLDFAGEHVAKPLWYSNARNGRFTRDQLGRYAAANGSLHGLPLVVDEEPGLSMQQITGRARAFISRNPGKTCLFEIDYIQKVEPADPRDNRERQVAGVAMGCKGLARKTASVVIAGTQFNEDDQKRNSENQRPRMSDVRESKVIAQESDWMFAPWRPVVGIYHRKPLGISRESKEWETWAAEAAGARHKFDLLCLKARHGREFDIELWAEMAASAIRDNQPVAEASEVQQAQADFLKGL